MYTLSWPLTKEVRLQEVCLKASSKSSFGRASVLGWMYIHKFRVWCVSSSYNIGRWCSLKYYYHLSILLMVYSVTSYSELRNVNCVMLNFNFTRGHFCSHDSFIQGRCLKDHKWVALCSSWHFLVNGDDPIPIWKESCSQNNNEHIYFLCRYIVMYSNFISYWLEIVNYLWTLSLTLKCMFILNIILRFGL